MRVNNHAAAVLTSRFSSMEVARGAEGLRGPADNIKIRLIEIWVGGVNRKEQTTR